MARSVEKREGHYAGRTPTPPGVTREPIDKNLDRLSYILDRSIRVPGTDLRFGVDPIISFLFPFAGDAIGAMLSAYIVLVSVRYGLPKGVIARMVFNVGADFAIGSIPFVGDLFDFAWKSNDKNMRLLEKHARGKGGSFWSDWAWVVILLGIVALSIFGLLALIVYAIGNIDLRAPFGRP
ncbi:MAG TPA: DUF4112 domain-containing protein [Blastocatellia bacterium]|nr:DUF4112 domain-containing protein [Blastocatellia bacterium]